MYCYPVDVSDFFYLSKDALDSFYMRNYPDYFATVGKVMVKKPDGTFTLVSEQELAVLKRGNKLALETLPDFTKKQIFVLKE